MGLGRQGSGFDASPVGLVGPCVRAVCLVALVNVFSAGFLAVPAAAQPTNDMPPSISGTPLQGQALTELAGGWSDALKGVRVQWESCPDGLGSDCTPIPNSPTWQGSQYTPTTSEVGEWLTVVETASDGKGDVSSVIADPVGPVTLNLITATMQWTFYYTPTYTKVMGLLVNGLASQATVLVGCRGHGCPFSRRISPSNARRRCGQGNKPNCQAPGTLNLSSSFRGNRLHVGVQITVAITIPGGIGKFYEFTVRAGLGPRIFIGCLAPGATRPGAGC
jgi:hypothetical protein